MSKVHNFSAGPCILPNEVFEKSAESILNFNESITLNSEGPFPNQTTKVLIQSINDDDKYTNEEYEYLYQLSLETFVDESEGKLSGAGAGLTDND